MPTVKSSIRSIPKPTSTVSSRRSSGAPMRKTVKGRISSPTDATYWLNLYWDQLHVGLMCAPAQHWSKKAADTEHHINRLMFGDIRRIGNRAHKVIFREKEECADV